MFFNRLVNRMYRLELSMPDFIDGWHSRCFVACKQANLPKPFTNPITLSVTEFRPERKDPSSAFLMARYFLRFLRDTGYLVDDNPERVYSIALAARTGTKDMTVIHIGEGESILSH